MFLVYCDDAGNTGQNLYDPAQPYHFLTGLLVPDNQWVPVRRAYEALIATHLPHVVARGGGTVPKDFELHAVDVWASKKSDFRPLNIAARAALFSGAMAIIQNHGLEVVQGCCDKRRLAARYTYPVHPHWMAAFLCLERIAARCNAHGELAVVIADQNAAVEDMVRDFVREYREKGPPFGTGVNISCITDNVHFLNSAESPHMQLCDIVSWLRARDLRGIHHPALVPPVQAANAAVVDYRVMPY